MEELKASVRKLMKEEEELHRALQQQKEQASVTLLEETHKVQLQNQELQQQVPETTYIHPHCAPVPAPPGSSDSGTSFVFQLAELQLRSLELHNLAQEQQDLRNRLSEVDMRRTQAEEQVRSQQNLLGQRPESQFLD